MREYRSESNERWVGFAHRPDDIVISTRSKSGTTWVQMICALLVFQTPDLPAPLAEISPWVDWDVEPVDIIRARLEAQTHRRILKTHTPLDGLPLDPDVTYEPRSRCLASTRPPRLRLGEQRPCAGPLLPPPPSAAGRSGPGRASGWPSYVVVCRDPLDVGLSLHHHAANIDRVRMEELSGRPSVAPPALDAAAWMAWWIATDDDPEDQLDRLPGVVHHAADAWARRNDPHVVLVHYQDLTDDLAGEMRRLAGRLGIGVPDDRWPDLVEAATFASMRARAADRVPDRLGVLRDDRAFFRSGRTGGGRALLDDEQVAAYRQRLAAMAPPGLVAWLDRR